ncbi:MAG TPA: MaoC family dehydratase [Candidatus Scatovivens faecipullorum]|nr:MaoC family dehydratase [Candidatus Scatovivens faecipullorum]
MNEYKLKDIYIGMTEEFSVKITEKMQNNFRNFTGDINPIHSDKDFAKEKGFDNILVFGMLTASFFSTLVGVYLPGKNCLFQECKDIRFHSPVFIGDTLKITGQVVEIDNRFNRITLKANIRNQEEKKVCSAKLIAGVL